MISISFNLLTLVFCLSLWSVLENGSCIFEKNVYSAASFWIECFIYKNMPLFWWGLLLWAHWWAWADPHHLIVYLLLKLLPADGPVWVLLQLVVGPKEPCYWLMPLGSLACVLVLAHWWAWLGTGWLLVRPKESVPEWLSSCCWIKLGPGAWYQPVAWWVWILGKLIVGHDVS